MRGLLAWVLVLVVLVVIVAAGFFALSRSFAQAADPPQQPIRFTHNFHVQVVQLDCTFCHRLAATEAQASVPSVEQCMFCHQVAGQQNPEVQKLLTASLEGRPIDWVRVHRVPDHVRFTHAPHIQAGVDCATCHGQVQNMTLVQQVRPLNMRDCVDCHRATTVEERIDGRVLRRVAPTECAACHY